MSDKIKCDNCEVICDPEFTVHEWGYPTSDKEHFCSAWCLFIFATDLIKKQKEKHEL